MSIISSCDHVITTTGTFSWWLGYLSKGIVLYYKNFAREGSWLKTTQFDNMDDYFLPEWIGLQAYLGSCETFVIEIFLEK